MKYLSVLGVTLLLAVLMLVPRNRLSAQTGQPVNASRAAGKDIGAKINGLITNCAGAYCSIYVPSGTYNFTTPIELSSNIELFGAGQDKTILIYTALHPSAGGPAIRAATTTAITAGSSTTKVKINISHFFGIRRTTGLLPT